MASLPVSQSARQSRCLSPPLPELEGFHEDGGEPDQGVSGTTCPEPGKSDPAMRPVRLFECGWIRYPFQRAATPGFVGGEMLYPPSRHSILISALPSSPLDPEAQALLSARDRERTPPSAVRAHRAKNATAVRRIRRSPCPRDPGLTPRSGSLGLATPVSFAGGCSNKRARRQAGKDEWK